MNGLFTERVGKCLCSTATILKCRCKVNLNVTVAGNGIVFRIDFVELPHTLSDNTDFDTVTCADSKRLLDALEFA